MTTVKTFLSILALSGPLALTSLMADTLFLKNGQTVDGTFMGGNQRTVRFRASGGSIRSYPVADIDDLQFGDSYSSSTSTGSTIADNISRRFTTFESALFRMNYPDNWQVYREGDSVTIAPSGGRVTQATGSPALAYGAVMELFRPQYGGYSYLQQSPGGQASLESATDQLIQDLQRSNVNIRQVGSRENIRVDNRPALSMKFSNDSPLSVTTRETDWLVTVQHPNGLLYMIFTAPEREFSRFESTFRQMLNSVQIKGVS